MVSEKKPSIYSDRGTIGSADELDEYGVWVKSGPQDLSSVSTGSQEFDDLSLPDFDAGFGEGAPDSDLSFEESGADAQTDFEGLDDLQIPPNDLSADEAGTAALADEEIDAGFEDLSIPESDSLSGESADMEAENFVDMEATGELETGTFEEEPERHEQAALSTQLLMKIADELSSIRTELTGLKKEFAGIRIETSAEDKAAAQQHGGFFSEEEDEKIALTGDELDNILSTADFTEEAGETEDPDNGILFSEEVQEDITSVSEDITPVSEDVTFSEDMAAVSEDITLVSEDMTSFSEDFSAAPEDIAVEDTETAEPSASEEAGEEDEEEIEIDFDDLGIDLNIDPSDFDKAREENAAESSGEEFTATPSLADMAIDLIDQDFAMDDFGSDDLGTIAEENLLAEENLAEENLLTEETAPESGAETAMNEIPLIDFGESEELQQLRDEGVEPMTPAPEDSAYLEEDPLAGVIDEEELNVGISLDAEQDFDAASIDLSEAVIDEPDLSGEITENPVEEPMLNEISLDGIEDINIDIEEEQPEIAAVEMSFEEPELPIPETEAEGETLEIDLTAGDDSLAQVIPEGFEAEAAEAPVPFDDDMEEAFAEEGLSTLDTPAEISEPALGDEAAAGAGDFEPIAEESLDIPAGFKKELKTVLSYMDQLLESLPEEKIEEFAKSEYFDSYKKLFKELGLV